MCFWTSAHHILYPGRPQALGGWDGVGLGEVEWVEWLGWRVSRGVGECLGA